MTVTTQDPAQEQFDYEAAVLELVRDAAPRLFAVVVEYRPETESADSAGGTDDRDAAVVAWGLAYESGSADVSQIGGGRRWSLASPEHVTRYFGRSEHCSARLVWLDPPVVAAPTRAQAA